MFQRSKNSRKVIEIYLLDEMSGNSLVGCSNLLHFDCNYLVGRLFLEPARFRKSLKDAKVSDCKIRNVYEVSQTSGRRAIRRFMAVRL